LRQLVSRLVKVIRRQTTQSHVAVIIARQRAVHAVGDTPLQIRQPSQYPSHKRLVDQAISRRNRPKISPTVIPMETRTPIHAETGTEIILVSVVIIQTAQVRHHASPLFRPGHRKRLRAIANRIFLPRGKIGYIPRQITKILIIHLVSGQHVEMVILPKVELIGQLIGPNQFIVSVHRLVKISVVCLPVRSLRVRPRFPNDIHIIQVQRGFELQTIHDFIFSKKRGEDTFHTLPVIVIRQIRQRITVSVSHKIAVPRAILVIDRIRRRHCSTGCTKRGNEIRVFQRYILIHDGIQVIHPHLQPFRGLIRHVDTPANTLETGVRRNSLLIQIAKRHVIRQRYTPPRKRCLVALVTAFLKQNVIPIHEPAPRHGSIIINMIIGIAHGFHLV